MDVFTVVENATLPALAVRQKCIVRLADAGLISIVLFGGSGPNGFRILSPARCSLRSVAVDTVSIRTRRNRRVCGEENLVADCVRIWPVEGGQAWSGMPPPLMEKWAMQQRYACARAKLIASNARPRSAEPRKGKVDDTSTSSLEKAVEPAKAAAAASDLSAMYKRGQPLWPLMPMEIARANGLWSGRRASCPALFQCTPASLAHDVTQHSCEALQHIPRLAAWAKGVTKTGRAGLSRREYKKQLQLIGAHNVTAALSSHEPPSPQASTLSAGSPPATRGSSAWGQSRSGKGLTTSSRALQQSPAASDRAKDTDGRVNSGSTRGTRLDSIPPTGSDHTDESDVQAVQQHAHVQAPHVPTMYSPSMPAMQPGMMWMPMSMPMGAPVRLASAHGMSHTLGAHHQPPSLVIQHPVTLPAWDESVQKQGRGVDGSSGLWTPMSSFAPGTAGPMSVMLSPRWAQGASAERGSARVSTAEATMVMGTAGIASPASAPMSQLSPSSGYTLWAAAAAANSGQTAMPSPTGPYVTGLGYMQSAQTVTGQTYLVNTAAAVPLQHVPASLVATMPKVYPSTTMPLSPMHGGGYQGKQGHRPDAGSAGGDKRQSSA